MTDLNKAVKKCPFCGCSAHIRRCFGFLGNVGYYVECSGCESRTYVMPVGGGYMEHKNGKATGKSIVRDDKDIINTVINKWNKRIN